MRIPAILAAIALSALAPTTLLAHVELTASTPSAGAETKAPKQITLTFSQPVDPATAVASIVMTAMPGMPNHGEMAIRNFTPGWSTDGKTLTLTLKKPLPTGTYEVRWQAAAADGHPMNGTISFDVG
jgi:methionine-rich copper-binding protein CopC